MFLRLCVVIQRHAEGVAGKDILNLAEAFEDKWEAWRAVGEASPGALEVGLPIRGDDPHPSCRAGCERLQAGRSERGNKRHAIQ